MPAQDVRNDSHVEDARPAATVDAHTDLSADAPFNPLYRFAPGIAIDPDLRAEIETAADFAEGSAVAAEITGDNLVGLAHDLDELNARILNAQRSHDAAVRAMDVAKAQLTRKLRAAGLVRTADGIKPAGI